MIVLYCLNEIASKTTGVNAEAEVRWTACCAATDYLQT